MAAIFFWLTLRFFNRNVYLGPTMLYINFGVDTVKIHRVDVTLLLLSWWCKLAKKNPSWQTLMVQVIFYFFFVDHIELDLCIQFQVNWTWNMVWGAWPFRNVFFFNCDATWPVGLILNNVSRCGTISIEFYPFGIWTLWMMPRQETIMQFAHAGALLSHSCLTELPHRPPLQAE